MSWNGSDQVSSTAREGTRRTGSPRCASASDAQSPRGRDCLNRVAKGRNPSIVHLLSRPTFYLLLLLALIGAALLWLGRGLSPSAPPSTDSATRPAQIATVAPQIVPHKKAEAPVDGQKVAEENVSVPAPAPAIVPHDDPPVAKARYDVFKHRSESRLAQMVCAPYGTRFIGGAPFDDAFMDDLRTALKEDIEISPDDPEDIRQYKESVIEVKKQLKEMFARGEDVRAELTKTWDELQKIGVYKQELETEMRKIQHQNCEMSNAELADLVGAVNSMLKDKGIEPLEYNKLTGVVVSRKPFPTPEDVEMEEQELNDGKDEEENQEEDK